MFSMMRGKGRGREGSSMTESHQEGQSSHQQFRLAKFFAYACLCVLLLASFPFSVVISQKAKDILLESYENYAILLGKNLNYRVFQDFVLPVISRYGRIRLREEEQFKLMDKVVRSTIHGFKIDLVNVYDIGKGVIAYSTDDRLVGEEVTKGLGYNRALKGECFSGVITGGNDLWGLGIDLLGGDKKVRTFIPFRGLDFYTGQKGYVLGVFEIIQDLSEEYQSIVRFQYLVFALSLVIMGMIFLALFLIVRRAESIMEERASRQRELESQLHKAERMAEIGQMCAGVSHEIRTPLGIIQSTAELLKNTKDTDGSQERLSSVIVEESSRLNRVVTEFLDFARPRDPNLQDCYLEEIIEKNLSFLRPELEMGGISVHNNVAGKSQKIQADPEMLHRVFMNIFMNSIQAMHEGGGDIYINIGRNHDFCVVTVEDTGPGVKEEDLRKLFDPFFTTKDKGTGLGLSIVKKIVEGHGGYIRIDSEKDAGTKVTLELPMNG